MRAIYFLFFGCIFSSGYLNAQNIFKGKVTTTQNNAPLVGVSILVNNQPTTTTNADGEFQFSASSDKISIGFSHVGYISVANLFTVGNAISVKLEPATGALLPVMVNAFERNALLKYMPVTVSVLGKTDLERYNDFSLVQAVNTVPGVKMDERSPGSYRLSIRGNLLRSPFGVRNVKVYWNGIPFTDANGNTYLNELGFNNVGKIEIIKGPGGSMYGAGTGGVMLLSTPVADKQENSIAINALVGSWGTAQTNVAYKKSTDSTNYTLQYTHQQMDGWRKQTNMRRDVAHYSGSFIINKKQTLNANIFYSDLYYQTPGGLTAAQVAANPRQSRPASGAFNSAAAQQAAIFTKTFYAGFAQTYQFNTNWSNTTSLYTSNTRFSNPSILNYQRKTEQGIGARSVTQYHHNAITVHAGAEYQYCFTSTRTFGNKLGVSDTLQFDDEIAATQYNVFLQTDINLAENFILNAGLSYNNYGYGFTRLNRLPVKTISKSFDPVVVPRVSLLKKISNNFSAYATVSKGYSPPTIDEIVPSAGIFNASLNAEKAVNYEVGFRSELVKNKLFVDAAYYVFYLSNTIVTRRDASGADYFVNAGNTKQNGLEATVNYYPIHNSNGFVQQLKVWSNYTNINARFKSYKQIGSDYSGNKLTGTPPNVFIAGVDLVTKPGFYLNVTYNYTDVLPVNDANSFFASQYNLLMGRAGYKKRLNKRVESEIYFSFDHSFNAPYSLGNDLNAAGNRYYNPAAPENYFGGVKLKFHL